MGWNPSPPVLGFSVLPTETVIVDLEVGNSDAIAVQLEHANSGQNLTARVKVALNANATPAQTSFPDFQDPIPPKASGGSRVALIQTRGLHRIQIVGELSGIGGNVDAYIVRTP